MPTFVSARTFCASRKPWFKRTRAGLTLTQSTSPPSARLKLKQNFPTMTKSILKNLFCESSLLCIIIAHYSYSTYSISINEESHLYWCNVGGHNLQLAWELTLIGMTVKSFTCYQHIALETNKSNGRST